MPTTTTPHPEREDAAAPPPAVKKPLVGLYDAHTHTPLCQHAQGEVEQYARVALRRGLAGLTVTCHNPLPHGYAADVRMREDQMTEYVTRVERARQVFEGKLDVRLGLEADFVPGFESYLEAQLASQPFDFVLGSVHPQFDEYKTRFYRKDNFAYQKLYFDHLAKSAESGLFDSLAHPDMVKHLMPRHWSISRIIDHACGTLDRIARTGVAMEFNTSGWRKPMQEASPSPRLLYELAARRIPLTLGSDAHQPHRVGENFEQALRLIQAAGYRHVCVFHQRQRIEVPIDAALRSLRPWEPAKAAAGTNRSAD